MLSIRTIGTSSPVARTRRVVGDRALHQAGEVLHHRVDVDLLDDGFGLAGVGEHPAHEGGGPEHGGADVADRFADAGLDGLVAEDEVHVAEHGREHVVVVVREAACEKAEALGLLHLVDLVLEAGALQAGRAADRDVAAEDEEPLRVDARDAGFDPDDATLVVGQGEFGDAAVLPGVFGGEGEAEILNAVTLEVEDVFAGGELFGEGGAGGAARTHDAAGDEAGVVDDEDCVRGGGGKGPGQRVRRRG